MVWKQPTGVFRAYDNPKQIIKVGTPGQADSMMVVAVTITEDMIGKTVGLAVAPEFKTDTGKQRQNQIDWQRAFEARGGVYAVVRSADDMTNLVDRIQRGEF